MKTFNAKDHSSAPLQLTKTILIEASITDVWKIVADHQGMTSWMPLISQVHLVTPDADGEWGEGCERHCKFGPDLLEEKIVHWDPPYGYAYAISDMHLMRNHVGHISLAQEGKATRVIWQQYFEPNGNFVKNFVAKKVMMPNVMRKALKNLAKKAA